MKNEILNEKNYCPHCNKKLPSSYVYFGDMKELENISFDDINFDIDIPEISIEEFENSFEE